MKRAVRKVRELIASCPGCLTFETRWFKGETMEPTKRFTQKKSRVYHDCRLTDEPCRLYPRFPGERDDG